MAAQARFSDVSEDDLLEVLEKRDSVSTKNVIKGALKVLKDFCTEKELDLTVTCATNNDLNDLLRKFYAAVRTQKGELYSKKSYLSIRYGLQKHFEKELGVDIVNSTDFKAANKIFSAMLAKLKREGKSAVMHKDPLLKEDLEKLYTSFDLDTPSGLQNKVFIDFMMYFCNRGRENLRELQKSDFSINENGKYIEMRDMATKNHKGDEQDGESQGGRIYKINGKLCPYKSFTKYLSVLNKDCEAFFQRPKRFLQSQDESTWYENSPVGKNTLGNKMKTLSEEAKLSRSYTNHCLRATSITLLDGFEARHIMTISGHKSETSIRSYSRTGNEQKEKMARTIAGALSGDDQMDGINHKEKKMQSVRLNETIAGALSGDDEYVGPSNSLNGIYHQEMTVQFNESTSGKEFAFDDMDLLELTSSQETFILNDIQNLLPITQPQNLPRAAPPRAAPVYYFPNSTVHIHHHN